MAAEGKPSFKDQRGDTLGFLLKATPEQLLEIAAGTALELTLSSTTSIIQKPRPFFTKRICFGKGSSKNISGTPISAGW